MAAPLRAPPPAPPPPPQCLRASAEYLRPCRGPFVYSRVQDWDNFGLAKRGVVNRHGIYQQLRQYLSNVVRTSIYANTRGAERVDPREVQSNERRLPHVPKQPSVILGRVRWRWRREEFELHRRVAQAAAHKVEDGCNALTRRKLSLKSRATRQHDTNHHVQRDFEAL